MLCSGKGVKKHRSISENLIGMMAKNSKTTKLERQIDDNLRRVYSDLSEEPLPDRFVKLLDELRKQENSKSDTQSGEES